MNQTQNGGSEDFSSEEDTVVPQEPNLRGAVPFPGPTPGSIEEELKECKDKYLRFLAEMENMRKRLQKEKQDATRFATENLIIEFLTPMDNLEQALRFAGGMSEEIQKWVVGFQMILAQFKDVLAAHGVYSFDSDHTLFDPYKHQAVEVEETDLYPEGTVMQEFVRGYRSGERTVRPARVKIAKSHSTTSQEKPFPKPFQE